MPDKFYYLLFIPHPVYFIPFLVPQGGISGSYEKVYLPKKRTSLFIELKETQDPKLCDALCLCALVANVFISITDFFFNFINLT